MQLFGFPLVENASLTVTVEDWSQVRSPARARRRRKLGHPQRIRLRQAPDPNLYPIDGMLVGHPSIIRFLVHADRNAARH